LGIEPQEASFRDFAGVIVSSQQLEDVPQKITDLLENGDSFSLTMQSLRTQMVFNLGNSIELGAAKIARLANEKALERQASEQRQA
jgi:hypothetical protein